MIDRRTFLAGAGGLALIAGFYWTRRPTAAAGSSFEVQKTEAEWRHILTPAQFDVLRRHATEMPGSGALDHENREGTFACAGFDLAPILFGNQIRERDRLAQLLSAAAECGRNF